MRPKNGKILIVEDDTEFRETLVELLEPEFTDVLAASDGRAALEILCKEEISIVITDIQMPRMNGIELIRKIKDMNLGNILILVMSGGSANTPAEITRWGAHQYFHKPIDWSLLKGTLRGHRESVA